MVFSSVYLRWTVFGVDVSSEKECRFSSKFESNGLRFGGETGIRWERSRWTGSVWKPVVQPRSTLCLQIHSQPRSHYYSWYDYSSIASGSIRSLPPILLSLCGEVHEVRTCRDSREYRDRVHWGRRWCLFVSTLSLFTPFLYSFFNSKR